MGSFLFSLEEVNWEILNRWLNRLGKLKKLTKPQIALVS